MILPSISCTLPPATYLVTHTSQTAPRPLQLVLDAWCLQAPVFLLLSFSSCRRSAASVVLSPACCVLSHAPCLFPATSGHVSCTVLLLAPHWFLLSALRQPIFWLLSYVSEAQPVTLWAAQLLVVLNKEMVKVGKVKIRVLIQYRGAIPDI